MLLRLSSIVWLKSYRFIFKGGELLFVMCLCGKYDPSEFVFFNWILICSSPKSLLLIFFWPVNFQNPSQTVVDECLNFLQCRLGCTSRHHNKTGFTFDLNSLILVLRLIGLEFHVLLSWMNTPFAFSILALTSASVPPNRLIVYRFTLPR